MSNEHPDDTYGFSHRYECIKESIRGNETRSISD